MERAEVVVEALELTPSKEQYLQNAHAVRGGDVYEVFGNAPRFFNNESGKGTPIVMLGPNLRGRFLMVPIEPTDEQGKWRVVTAYWVESRRANRIYGR